MAINGCMKMNDEEFLIPRKEVIKLSKTGWNEIRKMIYERDGGRCIICGSHWKLHFHHIVFRSSLGSDTLENLVCVCFRCHGIYCHGVKEKRWRESFKEYMGRKDITQWNKDHQEQAQAIYKRYKK